MTKVGRFSVTVKNPSPSKTVKNPSPSKSAKIIANNKLRRNTRKLPTWLERVFGHNTPQSEEVRKQMVRESERLGKLKVKEILNQIEENKKLREITNKIKATQSKETARKLGKQWVQMIKTKKNLRTRTTPRRYKTTKLSSNIKRKMTNSIKKFSTNLSRSTLYKRKN